MHRVFLLSPANASGQRARMVMNERAEFALAVRLRQDGAELGELFAFISGLYFRGKATYAKAFAAPPPGVAGTLVITAGRGLLTPETVISSEDLLAIAKVPIDVSNPQYRDPLERDALRLHETVAPDCEVVLLGSIASSKYIEPLVNIFGPRLLFPSGFVGRGDMSRGGLMLRCVQGGKELEYVPVFNAIRRGRRPPKLAKVGRGPVADGANCPEG